MNRKTPNAPQLPDRLHAIGSSGVPARHRTLIRDIYNCLLKCYGPQGWWPVTPRGGTQPRYTGGPRNNKQIFEVMAGAVLTQNTSWDNVQKALAVLHRRDLLSPEQILKTRTDMLARAIRPSGYYNQKAIKLKALAQFLQHNSLTKLKAMGVDSLRAALLEVHGVGQETADSIILYALGRKIFVVDAYTKRLLVRIGVIESTSLPYDYVQSIFHQDFTAPTELYNEYHALIVRHAKFVCRSKPLCSDCGLAAMCRYSQIG